MYNKKKQNKGTIYQPGEEINLERSDLFKSWDDGGITKSTNRPRIWVGVVVFVVAYVIVAMRLLDVCLISNFHDIVPAGALKASENVHRADIIDRNGAIVATSLPTQDLDANAKKILKPKATTEQLVKIFPDMEKRFEDTYKKLKSGRGYYTIRRNLTPHQQSSIMAMGNPGLEFRYAEKRVYPHKNLTGHIIGKVDIDNNGVSGLELGLNDRITSSDVPVKLSVDIGIQDTVRSILQKYQEKFSALAATAILMNANTAEIVAMVSLPDFDPNNNIKNINATFNQATTRIYEPGSVLKVFNTAMALDSGKVKVNEIFDTVQPLKLKYNTIKEFHGQGRPLNVKEILVHSSNVGSARMALKAGFSEQHNFLKKIKMLETVKMELPETARPLVMKEERWKQSDSAVATIGYGYGLAVSPLHLAAGFAAIINGGLYNTPTVLSGKYNPEKSIRVMSDHTSKQMRQLLRAVVTEGSGRNANVLGYEVGGKTGTANKQDEKGYGKRSVRTTFMAGFPMSDPKYVLVVMLDEPKALKETFGHTEAGWNAVPAAGEIIAATAPQLGIPANEDLEERRNAKIIEASFAR